MSYSCFILKQSKSNNSNKSLFALYECSKFEYLGLSIK